MKQAPRRHLPRFDDAIAQRSSEIADAHPWWPCRRGCDACCRSLGDVPFASEAEWNRLGDALLTLDSSTRDEVFDALDALVASPNAQPVTCPMLDRAKGACRVYEARPLVCRTHGFYTSRGEGRWCSLVDEALAARPEDANAICFGNRDALDATARTALGEPLRLDTWWMRVRETLTAARAT